MGERARLLLPALAALALLAATGPTLLGTPGADAQTSRSRRDDRSRGRDRIFPTRDWGFPDDYSWSLQRMQSERLASQEEQAREAGRAKRRDELQARQEAAAADRTAYFDAIIEASRAALRAPQGAYYRRPGFRSSEPPAPSASTVETGGISYLYDQGIFWLVQGDRYVVVPAPVGAVVPSLPRGAYPVPAAGGVLQYSFGTFYRRQEGACLVVAPPPGVVVSYIPDGYDRETVNGRTFYSFGPATYRPVFVQGILAYQVVAPPP